MMITKKESDAFIHNFSRKLERNHPDICFYTFGSYNSDEFDHGRSDIDCGLIIDAEVFIDTEKLNDIGKLYAQLCPPTVETDMNVIDTVSAHDGRFLSYSNDYTYYLQNHAAVYTKKNSLTFLHGLDYKSSTLNTAALNFCGPRGIRTHLLKAEYMRKNNESEYEEFVTNALEKAVKFPKKILYIIEKELVTQRSLAAKRLSGIFPQLDLSVLDEIDHIFKNYAIKRKRLYDPTLLERSVSCVESIVKAYLHRYPSHSSIEHKFYD